MTFRVGILSTAQITPRSLLEPARELEEVEVAAVASRDIARARSFADEHSIPVAYPSYEVLLADPTLDAIYIPLPPSLHARWSISALRAGHDVLCEKPFAANAEQARTMVQVAEETGRCLVEAFHWRYHPLAQRSIELARQIGPIVRSSAQFKVALANSKIGYRLDLAGGAMMGVGCYPVHWLRTLMGEEPVVLDAIGIEGPTGIDLSMEARLQFPSGAAAEISVSMDPAGSFADSASIHLEGLTGQLDLELSPTSRRVGFRVTVTRGNGERVIEENDAQSTYSYQLRSFARIAAGAESPLTGGQDAIANMEVIDAIYRAAGFVIRTS